MSNNRISNEPRKYYDQTYFKCFTSEKYIFYHLRTATVLKKLLEPRRVLDIGCAKGFTVYAFRDLGVEAYGVDVSYYAIATSPPTIKNYLLVVDMDNDVLPFPDHYFDLILMTEVIEHLANLSHALSETNRVLAGGGFLFVTTPNPRNPFAAKEPTHINLHDKEWWSRQFKQYGFYRDNQLEKKARIAFKKAMITHVGHVRDLFRIVYWPILELYMKISGMESSMLFFKKEKKE